MLNLNQNFTCTLIGVGAQSPLEGHDIFDGKIRMKNYQNVRIL